MMYKIAPKAQNLNCATFTILTIQCYRCVSLNTYIFDPCMYLLEHINSERIICVSLDPLG